MNRSFVIGRIINILVGLLIILGFSLVYFLWENEEEIPILGKASSFVLESSNGEHYDSNNNKVKLLAFFYTHCPDICPITMMDFQDLQDQLKNDGLFGEKVELVAITLDPENDSIALLNEYASSFESDHEGWKFLRGTPLETKEIADSYHMFYQKVEGDFIAHNTTMFLIDGENRLRGLYDMATPSKSIEKEEIYDVIVKLTNE
ncbi:SCO family protein [Jeotgalibacillus soli]|uniref:Thioredoxin domain-containing protein n=1 Tax=Jeotgalibacillus soli TaxID=889306 RepID=A0A0C2VSX1_9BACL|nr:SCO family protein [Jeotgalibacillus soli]KIL52002.1 hypothetical protein KP78_03720 [Jeotgalibacillus soli]